MSTTVTATATTTKPQDLTETQVLKQLISQQESQASAQQQSLYRLLKQEQVTTLGTIESERSLASIRKIDEVRFVLLLLAIAGILLLMISTYISIKQRYSWMIQQIDSAIASGGFSSEHGSGWFIAFAYEYPIFSSLRYNNDSFPAAVVYAYYTSQLSQYMVPNQNTYLEEMFQVATNGLPGVNDKPTAQQIVCNVIGVPNNVAQCEQVCPGPNKLGLTDYATSGATWGMNGAFLGNMIVPGAGGAVGFIAGTVFGAGLSLFKEYSASVQCNAVRAQTHCLPNTQSACS